MYFEGQVAVGVGDNLIRVWTINDQKNAYSVTSLWQGIKSKVTAVSFLLDDNNWIF